MTKSVPVFQLTTSDLILKQKQCYNFALSFSLLLAQYASACAAVQSVIHALEKDGFTSEVNETTTVI